jgi:hypothetical protein
MNSLNFIYQNTAKSLSSIIRPVKFPQNLSFGGPQPPGDSRKSKHLHDHHLLRFSGKLSFWKTVSRAHPRGINQLAKKK